MVSVWRRTKRLNRGTAKEYFPQRLSRGTPTSSPPFTCWMKGVLDLAADELDAVRVAPDSSQVIKTDSSERDGCAEVLDLLRECVGSGG